MNSQVSIRAYRPDDFPAVREIYIDGHLGPNSAARVAMQRVLRLPLIVACYCLIIGGICLGRPIGGIIAFSATFFIAYTCYKIREGFRLHAEHSLETDLGDILKHYRMSATGEFFSPSGVWVAELCGEVIGCIALDYYSTEDESEGELTRMVVSSRHRRRNVATLLIRTLLAQAKAHDLKRVFLTTTTMQPNAIRMYEGLGWKYTGKFILWKFRILEVEERTYERSVN